MFARIACVAGLLLVVSAASGQTAKQYRAEHERKAAKRKAEFAERLARAYIGATLSDAKAPSGDAVAAVQSVDRASPAAKAGLLAGDIVLAVNGQAIASAPAVDAKATAGSPLELSGLRYTAASKAWSEAKWTVVPTSTRDHVLSVMKTDDKVKNAKRYSHPDSDKAMKSTELVPYIQVDKRNGHQKLMLRFQYSDVHELGINRFSLRWTNYDGTIPGAALKFERGKAATRFWEWTVIEAEPYLPILHDMLEAEEPVVRYHGKDHFHDHALSDRERKIITDTLLAWYALTTPDPGTPRTP